MIICSAIIIVLPKKYNQFSFSLFMTLCNDLINVHCYVDIYEWTKNLLELLVAQSFNNTIIERSVDLHQL